MNFMHWMQRIHRPTARKQVIEEGYRLRSGDIAHRKRRSVQRAICVGLRCASLERFLPWDSEIPGDADSPLEEDGFELAVPPRRERLWAATPGKHCRFGLEPVSDSAFRAAVSDWQRPEAPFAGAGPMVRIRIPPAASLRTIIPSV